MSEINTLRASNLRNLESNQNRIREISSMISKEPNQGIIDHLNVETQVKAWEHWLKLLEEANSNTKIEVGSTVGGFNPLYNRWKITGEYNLGQVNGVLQDLQSKIMSDQSCEMRVCARIFVPFDNLPKEDFEAKIALIAKKNKFEMEYSYYQKSENNTEGLVVLFGKNGEKRQIRRSLLTNEDLSKYQNKIQDEAKNNQINSHSLVETKNEKDFEEIHPNNLTQLQKIQLTYYWRKYFGTGYDLTAVEQILNDSSIVKTIMTDKNGNTVGACTGETDGLGGLEVTEFFARNTFNNNKTGKFMLESMIDKCQKKYPKLQIYMEANMSSAMPLTAIKSGFIIPKIDTLNLSQITTGNVKVDCFGKKLGTTESYNSFALLVYPLTK